MFDEKCQECSAYKCYKKQAKIVHEKIRVLLLETDKQLKASNAGELYSTPFMVWVNNLCIDNLDCSLLAITDDSATVSGSSVKKLLELIDAEYCMHPVYKELDKD